MAIQSQVETVGAGAEKAKLAVAVLLAIAALAAFYLLARQGAIVQWLALIVGLVAAVGVFAVSASGRDLIGFGKDSWREVRKVVWPERKEAMQMSAYVLGFVVVMALFLLVTDKILEWVLYSLILGWK